MIKFIRFGMLYCSKSLWLFGLISILCSCATFIEPRNVEGSDLSILSPKEDMALLMFYEMCPALSIVPSPRRKEWKISSFGGRYKKQDVKKHSKKLTKRNCSLGANNLEMKLLPKDHKLHVEEISMRSDSYASNRIFLKGFTFIDGVKIFWVEEVEGDLKLTPFDRISSVFNPVSRGSN